ncbi:DUF5641 domain-containing protein [Trichonephila clavipes]|nr:DUF5641 domain-containing protein [Trichonephila clavipes]
MQDLTPITPARFLFEMPTADTKDLDVRDANHFRKRLRFRAKVIEELKRRFRNEYFGQLIQRQKQHPQSSNSHVGDIVLIGDDWKKRFQWSLARVIKLIPGKDELLLQAEEVVVEVRMGIGNKVSFCIVGNIADVEGMAVEGTSLDIGILAIDDWDFDIVDVKQAHQSSGSDVTPLQKFSDLSGVTINGQSKNTLVDKNDLVCRADTISISKSPDCNFLTDFGSPPIPFRAF